MLRIWGRVLCTSFLLHFQAIFLLDKIFINKFFNTILKFTGAYIFLTENNEQ